MTTVNISSDTDNKRATFFRLIFGDNEGYVCIAHSPQKGQMLETYFKYPDNLDRMLAHINDHFFDSNVYFCPQLLKTKKRTKNNILSCPTLWADLDDCPPDNLRVKPSVVIETSNERFQSLWVMESPLDPSDAEDYSRRIAYAHADEGADKSGWDLTQLLRVPFTYNNKYGKHRYIVQIVEANKKKYRLSDFTEYPQVEDHLYLETPFPEELPDIDAKQILEEKKRDLKPNVWSLFYEEPDSDWSKALWTLELLLFESGLDTTEVYIVCQEAACNKYARDDKSPVHLWREVCKAEAFLKDRDSQRFFVSDEFKQPVLLSDEERSWVNENPSIVEKYVEWAKSLGDAAWQYHQAGAFVILSSLLSSYVRLPTSYGTVIPNLWFMILADTTLTRKTTAMDIAMDIVLDIDSDCVLATDGSIEGLMTSISTRPGRASIFLRDEFSGLLEMMTKRDYYAGMAETLTKLYDGKFQKRVLRREIIEIREPILITFAGGIRTRIYELLNYSHVSSGFLPRFIFIAADSDITKLRPLGPPTEQSVGIRDDLVQKFGEMYEFYASRKQTIKIRDKEFETALKSEAELTEDAWLRYNRIEAEMLSAGMDTDRADLMTPTLDRLSKSGLKMATLMAATRLEEKVVVTEKDIVRAFYYIEQWSLYTLDLMTNIGKSTSERQLDRILRTITQRPGSSRSAIMQSHHLLAREADAVFATLEQRGQIKVIKRGRSTYYEPV